MLNIETIFQKLQEEGVEIEAEHLENPQLLSIFNSNEILRKINWKDKILEIKTAGTLKFKIKAEDDEYELNFRGPVTNSTKIIIDNTLINDDALCSMVEPTKYFADRVIIQKMNRWEINGEKMKSPHMYEAIYEYISGEEIDIQEYKNFKNIITENMGKNK